MDTLRDYDDKLYILYNELGLNMDDNAFTQMLEKTIDALVDDVEPNFDDKKQDTPWCYYYAFDCNWGRNEKAKEGVQTFGNERAPLTSAEELYNFIMLDNGMDEYIHNQPDDPNWFD